LKKVIDYNALRENGRQVHEFFAASPENVGVLTEMFGVECLKRDSLENYRKCFQVLEKYSDRIVSIKPFAHLTRIYPNRDTFMADIVDREFTNNFPRYCQVLLTSTDPQALGIIQAEQDKTKVFMAQIQGLSNEVRDNIAFYEKSVPSTLLGQFKSTVAVTQADLQFVASMVSGLTRMHFERVFPNQPHPDKKDCPYWFPFRYHIALQLLTFLWIKRSGYQTVPTDRLRNDSVDIYYVAYGTLFDGVVTEDTRMQELSLHAAAVLRHFETEIFR
jgi:hypothetical protein